MTEDILDWLPTRLLDCTNDAVLVTSAELDPPGPHILYANGAWERQTGYALADVRGHSPRFLQGPETERAPLDRLRECLKAHRPFEGEILNYRADGVPQRIQWRVEPIHDQHGRAIAFGSVQRVIEAASKSSARDGVEVLSELRTLVDDIELDVATARQRVARAAVRLSGAEAGVVEEPEDDDMVYRAVAGRASGLEGLRLPMTGSASGRCFTSTQTLLIDDTLTDERVQLDQKAAAIGFRAGILVPLSQGSHCFGVLKVYADTPHAFTQVDCDFLAILAGLLGGFLYRARAYALESERRRHLVDALPMLVAYVDVNRRYREVNAAYADWFGRPISDFVGRFVWDILGASTYATVRPYMDRALDKGETVTYEETITLPDDREVAISVEYSPEVRADSTVAGCYVLVRDVTKARAADFDYLTGLPNRRRFEGEAVRHLEVAQRYSRPLSLILVDVDDFKQWNDVFGHQIGDRILQNIADLLRSEARATDLVARWGGEEFVILALETEPDGATAFAERIRERIAQTVQPEGEAATLSFGLAAAQGDQPTLTRLMHEADHALYEAKRRGRNCVVPAG